MTAPWSLGRARAIEVLRSDFVRQVAGTLGTRVALIATGLLASVLVARTVGPEGRGALAIATALTAIAIQLSNLGLHASNTWAISKDEALLPKLIGNSLVVGIAVGLVAIVSVLVINFGAPGVIPITGTLLSLALLAIPIGLTTLLLQNLLLGLQRVRDYNVLELLGRVGFLLAVVVLVIGGATGPIDFMAAGTAISFLAVVVTVSRLWAISDSRPRAELRLVRQFATFGLRAYWAALISFLVIRLDLFVVEALLGFGAVGQYSVAVAVADLLYMLPVVVGTLLFPRLARIDSTLEQLRITRDVALRIAALMLGASVVAAVLAESAITLLYGAEFAPAVPAFIWLLPGIVALSGHTIVMNYCASIGMPRVVLIAPAVGLLTNLGLNIVLVPRLGIVGASIASSIAYTAMALVSAEYFVRRWRSEHEGFAHG